MGQRAVRISSDLWQEWCTKGFQIGGDDTKIIRCTEGLLPGAKAERFFWHWNASGATAILTVLFSHPDWEGPAEGEPVPDITIQWQVERSDQCGGLRN
jgi:hypothetical protein